MKFILIVILILAALIICPALAGDVTLKTSQNEYTFAAGEEARVPFVVESTFPKTNVGNLEYTLTRKASQGGLSFSQSSSQSQSFPISPGSSQNAITLNSDDPSEYEVSLSLHFRDSGKDFVSTLPPFVVQFTSNQSSKNQGSSGSSSSQSANSGSQLISTTSEEKSGGQGQSSDPFDEMDQQMNSMQQQNQQLIQQMLSGQGMSSGSGSSAGRSQSQNAQQALQNNQMNAQSSALQQQLAQETSENKKNQQDLADKMHQDPMLNQVNQDLKKAGYQQKDGSISADGKDKGSISAQYKNSADQGVSLEGDIENGSLKQLTASSNESLPVPSTLAEDSRYQAEKKALEQAGYNQTGGSQTVTANKTTVDEQYNTPDGKNATISSVITNDTVESVTVKKDEETPLGWYLGILLLILLICLCCWAGYRYYIKRSTLPEEEIVAPVEPVNIRVVTEGYLEDAETAIREERIKDAYACCGQALRFFISHSCGSGTADTTEEILSLARNKHMEISMIGPVLERCMMVEYARSTGSSEEAIRFISDIRNFVTEYTFKEVQE